MNKFDITKFDEYLAKRASMVVPKVFKSVKKAKMDYKKEIKNPLNEIKFASQEFWDEIIEKALSLGIDLIGFTTVDENFMFEKDFIGGFEVLYENGIVLGMEMKYNAIETAPEPFSSSKSIIFSGAGDNLTFFDTVL